ncbi:hypothetical protein [Streptomyces sp. 16-176A]|uniref:hypothetical protein n=1 Tax=Streptomyces sp. 16-176A TaxID=2530458 RepID=UPI00345CD0BB
MQVAVVVRGAGVAHRIAHDDADPAPYLRRARVSRAARDLAEGLRLGYRGIHPDDIALCLEAGRFPFPMTARREGPLTVLRPAAVTAG